MAPEPRKIGLALGSGAARGMAHIGVLKVLAQEGIPVAAIAGTSIGAFIGALHAAGVPPFHMEQVACRVDWRQMARLLDPILPTSGLIDGKKVGRFMAELLPARTFEELAIPLAVVATDIETGEALVIRRGELLPALQAAVAFPGIFSPVRFGDRFLVDGGLRNPVPVDVARELGADKVIGVCAIPAVRKQSTEAFLDIPPEQPVASPVWRELFDPDRINRVLRELWPGRSAAPQADNGNARTHKPPGIMRVCAQSIAIMENEITDLRLALNESDLLIRPDLDGITLLEFHRAAEAIRAGEAATRSRLPRIRALAEAICIP
jgi:NTE family protein